jgi:cytolysin (calcineurin-like family phosphatase)
MKKTGFLFLFLVLSFKLFGVSEMTFIVASDSHYGINQWANNEEINKEAIQDMNGLPGLNYPFSKGGVVGMPLGVIVAGDLTDAGTYFQWNGFWLFGLWDRDGFVGDYGLNGEELLRYPVYEGYGNHDIQYTWQDQVREDIRFRNTGRTGVMHISNNGYHYSWDWQDVHLVQLNLYPGMTSDAAESLDFLIADLKERVGASRRPVILIHHYGFDVFSIENRWWTEEERDAYYDVIKDYNVIGIFNGHSHELEHIKWRGIDTFAVGDVQSEEYVICCIKDSVFSVIERDHGQWTDFSFSKQFYRPINKK